MTESRTRTRLKILAGLVVFMFAALTTRLWFLQVLAAQEFTQLADQNQLRLVRIPPLRGQILDRNGQVLVDNRSSTVVVVDRTDPGFKENSDTVLFRLSQLLKVPATDLVDRLNSVKYLPYQPVPVAEDVSKDRVFYIEEHPELFPGVSYQLSALRDYPDGTLAAHVLGYVGEISDAQLSDPAFAGYKAGDVVGKAGLEATYEHRLQGTPGIRAIQVNAQGKVLDADFNEGSSPARAGDNLVTSLDLGVQKLAEQSLALGIRAARTGPQKLKATGGAVIVMDPKNGQVVAMASAPTYDPAIFEGGISRSEAARLDLPYPGHPAPTPTHNNPLLNRALLAAYPPGSTFKPFVAAAALRDGFASQTGSYACPPSFTYGGVTFHNWSPHDYGHLSLPEALAQSCDTVFYQYGLDWWRQYYRSGRTDELMQKELSAMGFGRKTGIDLPAELAGRVPTEQFKHDLFASAPKVFGTYYGWLPGDYINMSIGQGFMLVTPMQLAVAYSAIANGGTLWAPRVGWKVEKPGGKVVQTIGAKRMGKLPVSRSTVTYLRTALTGVTTHGTAAFSFLGFPLDRIPVAGKTGTADITGKQPFSWFAAMAPANDPKYVVVAMVEQGGHGSTTAAPVVRRILDGLFGLQTGGVQTGQTVD